MLFLIANLISNLPISSWEIVCRIYVSIGYAYMYVIVRRDIHSFHVYPLGELIKDIFFFYWYVFPFDSVVGGFFDEEFKDAIKPLPYQLKPINQILNQTFRTLFIFDNVFVFVHNFSFKNKWIVFGWIWLFQLSYKNYASILLKAQVPMMPSKMITIAITPMSVVKLVSSPLIRYLSKRTQYS